MLKTDKARHILLKNMVLHDNIKAGINEVVHYVSIDLISTDNCDARYRRDVDYEGNCFY